MSVWELKAVSVGGGGCEGAGGAGQICWAKVLDGFEGEQEEFILQSWADWELVELEVETADVDLALD